MRNRYRYRSVWISAGCRAGEQRTSQNGGRKNKWRVSYGRARGVAEWGETARWPMAWRWARRICPPTLLFLLWSSLFFSGALFPDFFFAGNCFVCFVRNVAWIQCILNFLSWFKCVFKFILLQNITLYNLYYFNLDRYRPLNLRVIYVGETLCIKLFQQQKIR